MKKLLFILLVSGSCFYANAQSPTPKGKFFAGGGFSYTTDDSERIQTLNNSSTVTPLQKESSFNISPQIGYMLTDNWAVGLGVDFQRTKGDLFNGATGATIGDATQSVTTLFPFVRYYYGLNDKVSFFGEANFGFGFGSREETTITPGFGGNITTVEKADISAFDINIRPGINFFLTDRIAVEGTIGRIGYASANIKGENVEVNSSNFEFAINPRAFSLGVFYWFK